MIQSLEMTVCQPKVAGWCKSGKGIGGMVEITIFPKTAKDSLIFIRPVWNSPWKTFFIKLPLLSIAGLTSSNPLLEFCLDGGISRKETSPSEKPDDLTKVTSLLSQCSTCSDWLSSDHPMLEAVDLHLRQTGCDINVQDVQGKTALHHLIQGMLFRYTFSVKSQHS